MQSIRDRILKMKENNTIQYSQSDTKQKPCNEWILGLSDESMNEKQITRLLLKSHENVFIALLTTCRLWYKQWRKRYPSPSDKMHVRSNQRGKQVKQVDETSDMIATSSDHVPLLFSVS